ncbi:hypothetical protein, partial [Bacillus proteolyticus]|uniref:hypothetical protein n=1 Tax=Bacillus proteolyticus TaxID=2026192 RepID=UPI0034442FFD
IYIVYGLQISKGFEGYWPSILFYTTYMTGVFIWIPIVNRAGILYTHAYLHCLWITDFERL